MEQALSFPIKIKKRRENAILPVRKTKESAGFDLCACLDAPMAILPDEIVRVPTGWAFSLPKGTAGFLYARSGLGGHGITLPNAVGVIDSDYRGEVLVQLINLSPKPFFIRHGDRIAQLVIAPVFFPVLEETDTLDETARGEGGFGSTGQNETEGGNV